MTKVIKAIEQTGNNKLELIKQDDMFTVKLNGNAIFLPTNFNQALQQFEDMEYVCN